MPPCLRVFITLSAIISHCLLHWTFVTAAIYCAIALAITHVMRVFARGLLCLHAISNHPLRVPKTYWSAGTIKLYYIILY